MKLCTPYYTILTNIGKKLQKKLSSKKKKRKKNLSDQLHVENVVQTILNIPYMDIYSLRGEHLRNPF